MELGTQPYPNAPQDQLPNLPIWLEALQQSSRIKISRTVDTGDQPLLSDAREAFIVEAHEPADEHPVNRSLKGKLAETRARTAHDAADRSEEKQSKIHEESSGH